MIRKPDHEEDKEMLLLCSNSREEMEWIQCKEMREVAVGNIEANTKRNIITMTRRRWKGREIRECSCPKRCLRVGLCKSVVQVKQRSLQNNK